MIISKSKAFISTVYINTGFGKALDFVRTFPTSNLERLNFPKRLEDL